MAEDHFEVLYVYVPSLPGADGPVAKVEGSTEPAKRREETVEINRETGQVRRRRPTAEERAIAEAGAAL